MTCSVLLEKDENKQKGLVGPFKTTKTKQSNSDSGIRDSTILRDSKVSNVLIKEVKLPTAPTPTLTSTEIFSALTC